MWDRPLWLMGLLAVPLLAILPLRASRALKARSARWVEPGLLARMRLELPAARLVVRLTILVAALALGVLALAGPRVGGSLSQRAPGEAPCLVIALDVSKSMGVADVAPNRMAIARDAMDTLLANLSGWRASLVVFADEAQSYCPMTWDLAAIQALGDRLQVGPNELKGGSNMEHALDKALEQLGGRPGAVVMISDGEQLDGALAKAAERAKRAGVRFYALGVGTSPGGNIPNGKDMWGQVAFRQDRQGSPILSHADLGGLQTACRTTGGFMVDTMLGGAPERIVAELKEQLGSAAQGSEGHSLYQWPLAIAFLALLLDWYLARGVLMPFRLQLDVARWRRRFALVARSLVVLVALSQIAWTWPWLAPREVNQAADQLQKGRPDQAIAPLERAVKAHPGEARLRYDLGYARYGARDFAGARKDFEAGLAADRSAPAKNATRQALHYNLGNALYRLGENSKDQRALWTQAIEHYRSALAIAPTDVDARYNLEFVLKRLAKQPSAAPAPQPTQGPGNGEGGGTPPPGGLPNEAEVRAMLDALQHEERQAQSDLGDHDAATPPPEGTLKDLWKRALNPNEGADRRDW